MSTTTGFDLTALTELVNETQFGTEYYREPIMENNTYTVTDAHGRVLTGAKNDSYKLPNMESTATVKDGSDCGFTPTDQTTIDQTDLAMVSLTIQGQFCVRKLEPFFMASQLPAGQFYRDFNPLEAQMLNSISDQIAKKVAIFPYLGPTGADTATYTTNWSAQLLAATGINLGTTNGTNGGSAGTDAAGVFNRVEAIANSLILDEDAAAGVMSREDYVVEMSPMDAKFYFENLRTRFGQDTLVPLQATFIASNYTTWVHPGTRIRCMVVNALGVGIGGVRLMIAWRKRNKVLAFDLRSDSTRLEMGMDQYRQNIWWEWRLKMGTGISSTLPTDVLYYGPAS